MFACRGTSSACLSALLEGQKREPSDVLFLLESAAVVEDPAMRAPEPPFARAAIEEKSVELRKLRHLVGQTGRQQGVLVARVQVCFG